MPAGMQDEQLIYHPLSINPVPRSICVMHSSRFQVSSFWFEVEILRCTQDDNHEFRVSGIYFRESMVSLPGFLPGRMDCIETRRPGSKSSVGSGGFSWSSFWNSLFQILSSKSINSLTRQIITFMILNSKCLGQ